MSQTGSTAHETHLDVLVFTTNEKGKRVRETGTVVDVSASGARLSWVYSLKQEGQNLEIEYKGKKAKFRVAWVGKPDTKHQGHVGVESLEPGVDIWGLPPLETEDSVATLPPVQPAAQDRAAVVTSWSGADRRQAKRLSCRGGVEFCEVGSTVRNSAIVSDICVGGCYIETRTTLAAETRLELRLRLSDMEIAGTGEVRICHPGMGLGVAFREMTPQNRRRLEELIEKLAAGNGSRQTPPPQVSRAKDGSTIELLVLMVDALKEKGLLTPEEHSNALKRARKTSGLP